MAHPVTPAYWHETQHSMLRRCSNWDYRGRGIYMLTLVTTERKPLLGALREDDKGAYIELTPVGRMVAKEAENIPAYYPQIRILCKQVMPDHLHLLLFVQKPLPVHLTNVISGFKLGCIRQYKSSFAKLASTEHPCSVSCAADFGEADGSPILWEHSYHDSILFHEGQLDNMIAYIKDNPRRLALKRANPDLFKIHQQYTIADVSCTVLGNMFLAEYPLHAMVQCSRRLTQAEIDARRDECLNEAANGVIHVSAAISEGEKQICRALREAGFPLIILLTEGFPKPDSPHYKYYKPQGVYFEVCAAGRLLLVEPSAELYDCPEIEAKVYAKTGIHDLPHTSQRYRFIALNALAEEIASNITT